MTRQRSEYIEELKAFASFPSISADSSKKFAVSSCARWLANQLKKAGLQTVEIHKTKQHPIVYAEHFSDPKNKTILFYGHYDVQPVDPLRAWKHPPFEPYIDGNHIYARGASDDKGQLLIHVKAIEELISLYGSLPVNFKCLFEGEEEIGSPNLANFIESNIAKLKCDVAVLSDTKMLSVNEPAITYSLRGSLNAEVVIRRVGKDLHSGTFGGMVPNPADVISCIVANLFNEQNRVNIPGFYAAISPVNRIERLFMQQNGPTDAAMLKDAYSQYSWGETGFSNYERTTIRPSVVVSGITCGYQGEGVKNVIPTQASIKINMRLVAGQKPQAIAQGLADFIKSFSPPVFTHEIKFSSIVKPVEIPRAHPYLLAAAKAYTEVFGTVPVLLRSGGTIPVVSMFKEIMNIPTVLMGFALATDDMHAPNEKMFLPNFFRGIETSKAFIKNVASLRSRPYSPNPSYY